MSKIMRLVLVLSASQIGALSGQTGSLHQSFSQQMDAQARQQEVDRMQRQINQINDRQRDDESRRNTEDFNRAMNSGRQEFDRQVNSPEAKERAAAYAKKKADLRRWVSPIFGIGGELKNADEIPVDFRAKVARDKGKTIEELFGHLDKPSPAPNKVAVQPHKEIDAATNSKNHEIIFTDSLNKAKLLYDFMADRESVEYKRVVEVNNALQEAGDPLYNDPNKPLIIAQMVARELRIAPKKKPD